MIPKIIWTFWNTEELPEFIQRCIETWKFYNPDYEINVMNINNYRKYTNVDVTKLRHYDEKKPQLTADYIRVCVLKEHGGVWMDASIICIKPIKFKSDTEFFAYYIYNPGKMKDWKYPMIENWFIASSKNNSFINEWCREFTEVTNEYDSMSSYVTNSNVEVTEGFFNGYYAMHVSAQKAFKTLDRENKLHNIVLISAWIEGPLLSVDGNNYQEILCKTDFKNLKAPIIKINGGNRNKIMSDKNSYNCIFNKIEKYEENDYIENLGYSNLDGYLQRSNWRDYKKRTITIIIISVIAIILLVAMVVIIKKK